MASNKIIVDETDGIFLLLNELSLRGRLINKDYVHVKPVCLLLRLILFERQSEINRYSSHYGIDLSFYEQLFLGISGSRKIALSDFFKIEMLADDHLTVIDIIEITELMFDGTHFVRPANHISKISEATLSKIESNNGFILSRLSLIVETTIKVTRPLLNRLFSDVMDNSEDFKIDPNTSCPCDSMKLAINCCYNGASWFKPAKEISCSGTTSNPKCYAALTNCCSSQITNEDYLTLSIVKHIARVDSSDKIKSWGNSWQKSITPESFGYGSFKAKILCKIHNNALSVYDSEALRFFESIFQIETDFKLNGKVRQMYLFNGEDIERWMLKVIIGQLLVNKIISTVNPIWLELLFCNKPMPNMWGMYFVKSDGYVNSFASRPIYGDDNTVVGAELFINNYMFILVLGQCRCPKPNTFRPNRISILKGGIKRIIEFTWSKKEGYNKVSLVKSNLKIQVRPDWDNINRNIEAT